ncbi:5901_t:CDS:2, partial [Funneliformis geosporum]
RYSDFWGDVQKWNVFYITKVPDCTPQSSHSALKSELEILLNKLPINSKKYKTATSINKSLSEFLRFSGWEESVVSRVTDSVHDTHLS